MVNDGFNRGVGCIRTDQAKTKTLGRAGIAALLRSDKADTLPDTAIAIRYQL